MQSGFNSQITALTGNFPFNSKSLQYPLSVVGKEWLVIFSVLNLKFNQILASTSTLKVVALYTVSFAMIPILSLKAELSQKAKLGNSISSSSLKETATVFIPLRYWSKSSHICQMKRHIIMIQRKLFTQPRTSIATNIQILMA